MKRWFKFGLIGLFSLIGFSCFCNAGSITYSGVVNFSGSTSSNRILVSLPIPLNSYPDNSSFDVSCFISNLTTSLSSVNFNFYLLGTTYNWSTNTSSCLGSVLSNSGYDFTCYNRTLFSSNNLLQIKLNGSYNDFIGFNWVCTLSGDGILGGSSSCDCPVCDQCPDINTGDILSGSCDTNYCVENDLCPLPSNFSLLYINDIEHQSAPVIDITIPEEFNWDYTVDSGEFNLGISGYNVDTEYIDGIIRTQTTKPNDTDFNNIVSYLIPLLVPGLIIIFFIWFIFTYIKKIF